VDVDTDIDARADGEDVGMGVGVEAGPGLEVDVGRVVEFTDEQTAAIERRGSDLLLDAGAGSGKTAVLVERFVRAVREDGVEVSAILTITFTEKAAAELRDRIRVRLLALGSDEQARATEGAFISTIHGFCARVLRAHALAAGLDPAFVVLDQPEAQRLADGAFDDALEEMAQNVPGGVDLVAAYGPGALRAAVLATYAELRSRGSTVPGLPLLPAAPDSKSARLELGDAAAKAEEELAGLPPPFSSRVSEATERLQRCLAVLAGEDSDPWSGELNPWPGELTALRMPGGNGAALRTPACLAYSAALARFRGVCEHRWAAAARDLLDGLLRGFGMRYARCKRECSRLDFEDLELIARELLRTHEELRERYAARFEQVMVDELQDVNRVQLELIESIARGNLFTVGDAQQSIYGFRHAEVELFERRGKRLEQVGARLPLATNFRSRGEILEAVNGVFARELGAGFTPLLTGRRVPPAQDARVELLIADKGADWAGDGLASPWRVAEARALAKRVKELIDGGAEAGDVVVLTRASTDLRAYERALEEQGAPTYVIGGRGYWSHPQVVDLIAYLRALANPREEEALYTVLASPLLGVPLDALVVLGAGARAARVDPWSLLCAPEGRLDELCAWERERLAAFAQWFAAERGLASREPVEELIERALERSGYDLAMLAMPGGARRLANVRKLMRLGREHEAAAGADLHGFLKLVDVRAGSAGLGGSAGRAGSEDSAQGTREGEAPVEGEALDAVRLMTIHRAKGLEFEIVCVADLGRGPRWRSDLLRVGRDGRFGLRLAAPGTGRRESALDYDALGEEQRAREEREERRLFYVAMTRARERLILSGAAKLDPWSERVMGGPIAWIAPGLVPDIAQRARGACSRAGPGDGGGGVAGDGEASDAGAGAGDGGACDAGPIRLTFVRPEDPVDPVLPAPPVEGLTGRPPREAKVQPPELLPVSEPAPLPGATPAPLRGAEPAPLPGATPAPAVTRLSYSSLGEYERCGYRFYAERVLGLPSLGERGGRTSAPTTGPLAPAGAPPTRPPAGTAGLSGAHRGVLVHDLLERLNFRRPLRPTAAMLAASAQRAGLDSERARQDVEELSDLVAGFASSELCARLARATDVRREEHFGFLIGGGVLVTGALDVLAREARAKMLVVDYKSDRVEKADAAGAVGPAGAVSAPGAVGLAGAVSAAGPAGPTEGVELARLLQGAYGTQRLVYALAALHGGAEQVEVVHVFLERPHEPLAATFTRADMKRLERELARLARGVLAWEFEVSGAPHRALCGGCPAEAGLCSWPLQMTRREAPDRLC